jgi:predicted aldo/keto reductase-like oxidoreductase
MKMRVLPKTGIKVTEIGLGCEHLEGQNYESVDKVISAAIDSGVNILDVFMSEPNVRTNIGRALAGRRNKVLIQGHIGAAWKDGQYARTRDPGECRYFFEDLLTRLQTDYIDIGMLHYIDDDKDFDTVFNGPVLQYALELKGKGTIKALGMSSHNPSVALKAVRTGLLDVLMFSINPAFDVLPPLDKIDDLFNPNTFRSEELKGIDPVRAELYKTCEALGVAITVMKGLGAGTLLNDKASPLGAALTPSQCIHYSLTRPAVASILVGARKPEELYTSLEYNTVTDEQKDYSIVLSGTSKYSLKGRCMYCNHCLPCPSEIDIAAVHKFLDLALISDTVPDAVKEHYLALNNKADACIQCGNCEANCPFEVRVIERMQQAVKVFG